MRRAQRGDVGRRDPPLSRTFGDSGPAQARIQSPPTPLPTGSGQSVQRETRVHFMDVEDDRVRQWSDHEASHVNAVEQHDKLLGTLIERGSSNWRLAAQVLYTWRDMFVTDVREMPPTKMVVYRIPTYPDAVPKASRLARYTPEEVLWQHKNIPPLEEAGIIVRC